MLESLGCFTSLVCIGCTPSLSQGKCTAAANSPASSCYDHCDLRLLHINGLLTCGQDNIVQKCHPKRYIWKGHQSSQCLLPTHSRGRGALSVHPGTLWIWSGWSFAPMVSLDSVTLELCFFLLLWEKGGSNIVLGTLKSNSMFLSLGNRLDMLWKVTSICVPLGPVLIFKVFKKNCVLTVLSP